MSSFFAKIKVWCKSMKQYVWAIVFVYVIHLSIEGFAVNLLYYNVLKPIYVMI